jgi:hypothetical protein
LIVDLHGSLDGAREALEQLTHAHLDPKGELTGICSDWDRWQLEATTALRVLTQGLNELDRMVDGAKAVAS